MSVVVVEISNPFNPLDQRVSHYVSGKTIRNWLEETKPGFVEFEAPTVCFVNGELTLRKDWDIELRERDVVAFVAQPGDPFTVFLSAVIAVVVAVAVVVLMPTPKLPGDPGAPDPVYSLQGQRNQVKLGASIERPYGKNRIWPSFAAKAYNKYEGNEQIQFLLFCLGQGSYNIHKVQIEETGIENFADTEYEIYRPGEQVTMFPDRVDTSAEVSNVELFGPNEDNYPEDGGWVGPFTLNPSGTQANRLEWDVVMPKGLYFSNDDGGLSNLKAQAEFQIREIDGVGNPLGEWGLGAAFIKTMNTITPQRFTLGADLPPGRYETRARRTNPANTSFRGADTIQWGTSRAFLPSTKDYGNVTLLAIKARASNNLNDQASNRVNVIATAEIPTWSPENGWSEPVPTRSLVWAFCDLFRSSYGGGMSDVYLDMDTLYAMNAEYEAEGIYFDWVFDQRIAIWDAAKTVARAGRSVPILSGSQVTLVRDKPKTIPTAVFTPDNIVRGSFEIMFKLYTEDEYDGIEAEYIDPDTFERETVECLRGGDEGDSIRSVTMPGISDRVRAWREGMYERGQEQLHREVVTFSTGMEGHIPTYGSLILISHDLPRWGQSGIVRSISGNKVTLWETVTFDPEKSHQIGFRKKDGSLLGPFGVVYAEGENETVELEGSPDLSELNLNYQMERAYYMFGPTQTWASECVVTRIRPVGGEVVAVEAVVYNPELYAFDNSEPPEDEGGEVPASAPDVPTMGLVTLELIPSETHTVMASWPESIGARSYRVESSSNGIDYAPLGLTSNNYFIFPMQRGPANLYVRVAAIGVGQSPWSVWSGPVGYFRWYATPDLVILKSNQLVEEGFAV